MALSIADIQPVTLPVQQIDSSIETLYTASPSSLGVRLDSLWFTNDTTTSVTLEVWVGTTANDTTIYQRSVTILPDGGEKIFATDNSPLWIPAGNKLKARASVADQITNGGGGFKYRP